MKIFFCTITTIVIFAGCAHRAARDQVIDYVSLIHAAAAGDELLVKALLDRGAPVNALGPDVAGDLSYLALQMSTPLQEAAENGHAEVVTLLIAHGAWLDAQCCDSDTPLGLAARNGHLGVAKLLLRAGADPLRSGSNGTPLQLARAAGHTEIVKLLESVRPTK